MNRLYVNASGSQFIEFSGSQSDKRLGTEIATRNIDGLFSSFYQTIANPDPVLRKTGTQISILDEIKREPHVSACSTSRESGVNSRLWKIEKQNASSTSAALIESFFKSINLRQIFREMLQAWGYGFQVSEIIWARQGNYLLPVKIVGKPQRWFMFDTNNELRLKRSAGDATGELVDMRKFILTRYRASYDNPYGEAQYSMCFWPVTFKKGGLKFWAVFLEKFGMPHAVGKLPRSANNAERSNLLDALSKLVRDACAVFPDDSSVELLTAAGISASSDAYERFAQYHDGQISTVLLGHSAAANSTPGRLGNENTALEVRKDIVDSDCLMIEDSINRIIQLIHELNPSLGTELETFKLYEETDVDTERADRDHKLMSTGRIRLTKKYFTKRYDYDDDDIEVVDDTPQPLPQFSAPEKPDKGSQAAIDTLAAGLPDALLQKQIETVLKPVFTLIQAAKSFDEVREKTASLFPELNSDEIENVIEKTIFLGETWGRLTN